VSKHTFDNDGSGYCRHPLDESTVCGKDEAWHYQIISICGNGPASGPPGTEYGESSEDGKCPKCGSEILSGYGLAFGGMGVYEFCSNDGCDWFWKLQDSEE
jgi:hypothetical protein